MYTIFVYGTLKRGGRWHHLLESAKLLSSNDAIRGEMYLHPSFYPMLFHGDDRIHGETYVVSPDQYAKIVELEFEYDAYEVITEQGHKAGVFFYHDQGMKEGAERIIEFNAASYFDKWLEVTPIDSPSYAFYLRLGGDPTRRLIKLSKKR